MLRAPLQKILLETRCIIAAGPVRHYSLFSFLKGESAGDATVEVSVVDPRTVLEHEKWKEENTLEKHRQEELSVTLKVPKSFLPVLSQGRNELGDMDDPMNNWYFGTQGEIFQYRLIGTHLTKSGYSSILLKDELDAIVEKGRTAGLPRWKDFLEDLQEGRTKFPSPRHPFLFTGLMVDTAEAAVYQLKEGGEMKGVLISSEAMGGGGEDEE